jgi:hypothetical protein
VICFAENGHVAVEALGAGCRLHARAACGPELPPAEGIGVTGPAASPDPCLDVPFFTGILSRPRGIPLPPVATHSWGAPPGAEASVPSAPAPAAAASAPAWSSPPLRSGTGLTPIRC